MARRCHGQGREERLAIIASSICRPETPVHAGDDRVQLDLGIFEGLLQALLLPGLLPHQGAPVTGQIPQLPDRLGVDQAGCAHAPLHHFGQPHRVQPVGLGPAGQVLDVAGVDHPAFDVVFELAAPVSSRVAAAHCCAAARWEPAVPAFQATGSGER
jgi:hypothetical protein